jgi:type VI secretion system protein ImpK
MSAAERAPPLFVAAMPIFDLLGRLRASPRGWDAEALRARVGEELRKLERTFVGLGMGAERARYAHYMVCATVDDLVLSFPAGSTSSWTRNPVVLAFHRDTTSGERFYEILDRLKADPGANQDLLELIYVCLAVGFEGRLRIYPGRIAELERIREDLFRALRRKPQGSISAEWRGVAIPKAKPSLSAKALVSAVLALLVIVLVVYAVLGQIVAQRSSALVAAIAAAPPQPPATLRLAPTTVTQRIQGFLNAEIKAGLVTVSDDPLGTLVRIRNQGMFGSGSPDVDDRFEPLLDKIAQAVAREKASLLVVGHSDNQPISTPRYASNLELSQARAQAVATLLGKRVDPALIRSEGRGAAQPIASNDNEQGRDANRRIDIEVIWARGEPKP